MTSITVLGHSLEGFIPDRAFGWLQSKEVYTVIQYSSEVEATFVCLLLSEANDKNMVFMANNDNWRFLQEGSDAVGQVTHEIYLRMAL
jgi:hypothetical protein